MKKRLRYLAGEALAALYILMVVRGGDSNGQA